MGLALDYVWDVEELKTYYKKRPDLFPPGRGYDTPSPTIEPERLPHIVSTMIDHGYGHEAIKRILGGNHLRVAQTVWK